MTVFAENLYSIEGPVATLRHPPAIRCPRCTLNIGIGPQNVSRRLAKLSSEPALIPNVLCRYRLGLRVAKLTPPNKNRRHRPVTAHVR